MTASTVKVMVKMRSVGVDDRMVMDQDEHLWGVTDKRAKGQSRLKYTELRRVEDHWPSSSQKAELAQRV
jgi:hypothetical protein